MGELYNLSQKAYFTSLGYTEGDEKMGILCSDFDQDGVIDIDDNCPIHSNTMQEDNLGGLSQGDACDDQDGDGVFDLVDNCLIHQNPDQSDVDADQMGDFCDHDIDNDGKDNTEDSDRYNGHICSDIDLDTCDDCSRGSFDLNNDGDDCSRGSFNTNNDGDDVDGDGICNVSDPDSDNDGVNDANEISSMNTCDPQNQNQCASNQCNCIGFETGIEFVVVCWCE